MRRRPPGRACVPAAGACDGPADPREPQRGAEQRGPLALAGGEPRRASREAHSPEVGSAATERGTRRAPHRRRRPGGTRNRGMLVWLAMVTGARRGECAPCVGICVDFATGVLQTAKSIAQQGATSWKKDTKTHQQRRITLDPQTLALLRNYHARRVVLAAAVGTDLPSDARTLARAGRQWWVEPDTIGQRYTRCAGLGGHAPSSAPALFGHRTDRRRSGRADRGRPARPWRRWDHNPQGVQRMALRGGPARREFARGADASSTYRG